MVHYGRSEQHATPQMSCDRSRCIPLLRDECSVSLWTGDNIQEQHATQMSCDRSCRIPPLRDECSVSLWMGGRCWSAEMPVGVLARFHHRSGSDWSLCLHHRNVVTVAKHMHANRSATNSKEYIHQSCRDSSWIIIFSLVYSIHEYVMRC